jgi:hypothetical protein
VDEKEQKTITFKLSAEETERLDAKVNAAGLSRSDYLRKVLFAPAEPSNGNRDRMFRYVIYVLQRIHSAIYLIAEQTGKHGVLSTEQLQQVYLNSLNTTLEVMTEADENITKMEKDIAEVIANRRKLKAMGQG